MKKLLCYDDVTLIPNWSCLSGRSECDTSIEFCGNIYKMPIILAPMTFINSPEMIYTFWKNNLVTTYHRYWRNAKEQYESLYLGLCYVLSKEEKDREIHFPIFNDYRALIPSMYKDEAKNIIDEVFFAVGGIKKHKDWIYTLYNSYGIKKFCVDFANGATNECIETCKFIKELDSNIKVISGNYANYICYNNEYSDAFRMGIGGGSCCETAQATGFYYPSLNAVKECAEHRKFQSGKYFANSNICLIADGGIKNAGDIAKAIALGADIAMCGKLFAGTSASNGQSFNKQKENVLNNDEPIYYKEFQGMASEEAKKMGNITRGSIEGKYGLVPYIGRTQDLINDIYENLKSALAYCGAKNWKEFKKNVSYAEISPSGIMEKYSRLL